MITHIEIDGFKSFLDFELDVPPFLALVGPNSSGKSNVLDAIDLYQNAVRSSSPMAWGRPSSALLEARRGRPHELFHQVAKGTPVENLRIEVSRLVQFPGPYLAGYLVGLRWNVGARLEDGDPREWSPSWDVFDPAKDPLFPDASRERTWRDVREEFQSWSSADRVYVDTVAKLETAMSEVEVRQYVPIPHEMRGLASAADTRALLSSGGNLAAVLGRMRDTEAFGDLMIDLAALVPDVVRVVPELDEKRQEWSFDLVIDGQGLVPSTLLSDGTLRVLGLLAALHDPDHPGVLMIEEIENGLHPSRLAELLRRMQDSVTDLNDPASLDRPLRQVILTSHSPVVVSELYRWRPESLIFMDSVVRVDPDHDRVSRVSVARPVRADGERGTYVSPRQVRKYLATVRQDGP
jgi:predicted ATPase